MSTEMRRFIFLRLYVFLVHPMFGFVKGQNETVYATLTQSYLYSPGYADGAYTENLLYDYRISTNYVNHTVLVTLTDCDIESIIVKGQIQCPDYFSVYDGYNDSAAALVEEFCCQTTPLPTFQSTADTMYIKFITDGSDNKRGFAMTVQSDGVTTTTTSATTTTNYKASSKRDYTWIIVGCSIGGVNLIIIIIIVLVCFVKKPQRATSPSDDHMTNRILWSRANTTVEPISTKDLPPGEVEVVQTNIFDMDLPVADGKANQLPPLSKSLEPEENENSFVLK